jgi:hypothetical protein
LSNVFFTQKIFGDEHVVRGPTGVVHDIHDGWKSRDAEKRRGRENTHTHLLLLFFFFTGNPVSLSVVREPEIIPLATDLCNDSVVSLVLGRK